MILEDVGDEILSTLVLTIVGASVLNLYLFSSTFLLRAVLKVLLTLQVAWRFLKEVKVRFEHNEAAIRRPSN